MKFYEALLQAYRENPGNVTAAAKAVGTSRETAKRAWDLGWEKFDWAPPIRDVVEEEMVIARSRIEQQKETEERLMAAEEPAITKSAERREAHIAAQEERARAKENAIKTRVEQGRMIEGVRKSVMQVEAATLHLGGAIQLLSKRAAKEIKRMANSTKKMKPEELARALHIIRQYSSTVREGAQSAKIAVEIESLHMGEPTQIIGLQSTNFDDASEEELRREIKKALQAMGEDEDDVIVTAGPGTEVRH